MAELPAIPGYRIEKRLGAGGMGVVFKAHRADTGFDYAVKMLLPGRTATLPELARFRVEAEAYACLNHPCIINIRDVGVVGGCPYLAMDYAANGSLDSYAKSRPELEVEWRVRLIRQVADGLAHAHGRRMLHRDLKPANILIMADGTPKVTDFGLVKFAAPLADVSQSCCTMSISVLDLHLRQLVEENRQLLPADDASLDSRALVQTLSERCAERAGLSTETFDQTAIQRFLKRSRETQRYSGELAGLELDEMTRAGAVLGSPQFMSPEQARGQTSRISPATDVYSLGATLYTLLTERPPISGRDAVEVILNVPVERPTEPLLLNNAVSEDLNLVVMKALEKDPDRRYPDMAMLGEDLDRTLCGRPALARLNARSSSPSQRFIQSVSGLLSTRVPGGRTSQDQQEI